MNTPATPVAQEVASRIGLTDPVWARLFKSTATWIVLALLLVLAAAWVYWRQSGAQTEIRYETDTVTRGDLTVTVSATGNLQPTTKVDVGSELSGTIEAVLVTDNDRVTKGQILARLDDSKLRDQVLKSQASLAAAQAQLHVGEASSEEARGNLERLETAWRLSGGDTPSRNDLEAARSALKKSSANESSAKANVTQAQATLRSDETNLSKSVIRSPITGVVLLRKIEPGQTVAASLNAPVLFTLAQSLTQMELQVNIDEADVGQVQDGQEARFTVDAYASRTYPARIRRVRFGSETTNGVVTYQGVLQVVNDDLSLRPGMTASATIITLRREKVLLLPNAALRYVPTDSGGARKGGSSVTNVLIPRLPGRTPTKAVTVIQAGTEQTVWLLRDGKPQAVSVKVGATNGLHAELVSGNLKEGDRLIVDAIKVAP
ncbi:MAG: efflux RND transporter periplasmic adaptor subunit [Burkholderiaceae bacterium]|nr:efflux RND transporter periplasmic adaptor subunit [Burkholderiaceae bacterium]